MNLHAGFRVVCTTRLPSSPLIMRVAFSLLHVFGFDRVSQKGKNVLLGNLDKGSLNDLGSWFRVTGRLCYEGEALDCVRASGSEGWQFVIVRASIFLAFTRACGVAGFSVFEVSRIVVTVSGL